MIFSSLFQSFNRSILLPSARLPHAERAVRGRVPGGAVLPGEERAPRGLHPLLLHLPDLQRVQRLRGEFGERPINDDSHFGILRTLIDIDRDYITRKEH